MQMLNSNDAEYSDSDPSETQEWLESLEDVLHREGPERAKFLLSELQSLAQRRDIDMPFTATTDYVKRLDVDDQPRFPGNREMERRIKSMVRWNAMVMVLRGNKASDGSAVTLPLMLLQPPCTR